MSAQKLITRSVSVYITEELYDSMNDEEWTALCESINQTLDGALEAVANHVQTVHPETWVQDES